MTSSLYLFSCTNPLGTPGEVGDESDALRRFPKTPEVLASGHGLLRAIRASASKVCEGAPLAVTVETDRPAETEVFINSTPGARRILQLFGEPGERDLVVFARGRDGTMASELVTVEVRDCGEVVPQIVTTLSHADPRELHFSIANHRDVVTSLSPGLTNTVPSDLRYDWKLDNGVGATTQHPTWTHRFAPEELDWGSPSTGFTVQVVARRPSGQRVAMRTFTVRPTYALARARGVLQPPVSFDPLSWDKGVTLTNVESDEKLRLESARLTLWHCDIPQPKELPPSMFPVDLQPGETRRFDFDDLVGERKQWEREPNVCGVGVHLEGKSSSGLAVEAHAYVELRESPHRVVAVRDPAVQQMLERATRRGLWPEHQTTIGMRDLLRFDREGRLTFTPGELPKDELQAFGDRRPINDDFRCDPNDPTGSPPGDLRDWVCKPTDRFEQSLPYVANAYAGDFALSAGCGMIGTLLRQLTPSQRFSHTGVFVASQDRIRHSTAAEERIEAGVGAAGLVERNLRYPQPGILTQNVYGAYAGEPWRDLEGRVYVIDAFSDETRPCDGDADPTPPTLVRWTHRETDADDMDNFLKAARDMAGHYRFFAYSDGAIGMDPAFDDPLGVPGDDGRNRATVCSSYLWTAAREAGLTLEASCFDPAGCVDGVLESRDRLGCESGAFGLGCAERDAATADGLYLYQPEERLAAGRSIYAAIRASARDRGGIEGAFGTSIGVPNRIANQVANCFATDGCSRSDDTDAWRDAEQGRAVSPDDLLFWDAPWGATEPLLMRQGLYRRIYTWQPQDATGGFGDIAVRVVDQEGNPVDGATVEVRPSERIQTSAEDGSALFVGLVATSYEIVAGRLFGDRYFEGYGWVELEDGEREEVEIVLGQSVPVDPNAVLAAEVRVDLNMVAVDHEAVRSNEIERAVRTRIFDVTAVEPSHHETVSICAGGEVRLEVHVHAALQRDGRVATTLDTRLYEGGRCSTDDRADRITESLILAAPSTTHRDLRLYNDERMGGDSALVLADITVTPR